MKLSKPPKPKATRKRLKKEILSDDFKKRKIFWKNIAEKFLENFPYEKIFYGKISTSHHYRCYIRSLASNETDVSVQKLETLVNRLQESSALCQTVGIQFMFWSQ
jgi:hypothetical protein